MPTNAIRPDQLGPARGSGACLAAQLRDHDSPCNTLLLERQRSAGAETDLETLEQTLRERDSARPLALHVHLPLDHDHRAYSHRACAARQPAPARSSRWAASYLPRLDREMVLLRRLLSALPPVERLHWSGATARLSLAQMSDLIDRLDARFGLSSSGQRDFSIELDPRRADVLTLRHLQALGFNRLSLDAQELNPEMSLALGHSPPGLLVESLIDEAERLGFHSLELMLTVGLPLQTPARFDRTLNQTIAMAPSRITLRGYRPVESPGDPQPRPDAAVHQALLAAAQKTLEAAGYLHIGLGQFARNGDRLANALRAGHLRQSLHGYTHHPHVEQLGLGVGAAGQIGALLIQNARQLSDYQHALDSGRLPVADCHRLPT